MRKRMLLRLLLTLVLILPTGLVLSPAALAEDEQPSEGAEGVPVLYGPPDLIGPHNGVYTGKFSGTYVLRDGKKGRASGELLIMIFTQSDNALSMGWAYFSFSDAVRAKARNAPAYSVTTLWPNDDFNGWVGEMYVDSVSGKPKNKPPLTAAWLGSYQQNVGDFYTSHLTATVKLDKNRNVKSIKGTISQSDWNIGYHLNAKFTVTPYTGTLGENGLPPGFELPPGMKLPQRPK